MIIHTAEGAVKTDSRRRWRTNRKNIETILAEACVELTEEQKKECADCSCRQCNDKLFDDISIAISHSNNSITEPVFSVKEMFNKK